MGKEEDNELTHDLKYEIALALGRTANFQTVEPLLEALENKHIFLRIVLIWFVKYFAQYNTQQDIERMIELLNGEDPDVRLIIENSLDKLHLLQWDIDYTDIGVEEWEIEECNRSLLHYIDELVELIAQDDLKEVDKRLELEQYEEIQKVVTNYITSIAIVLGSFKDNGVLKPLIKELRSKESRGVILSVLKELNLEETFELLVKDLEDEDYNIRRTAIVSLGELQDSRSVDPLVKILENKEEIVRLRRKLEEIDLEVRKGRYLPIFKEEAENNLEKEYMFRIEVIKTLERIKDTRAVEVLIQELYDGNEQLSSTAARAVGWIGDKNAVKPLISLLKDEKKRDAAVYALIRLNDKRVIEPFEKLLEEEKKRKANIKQINVPKKKAKLQTQLFPLYLESHIRSALRKLKSNKSEDERAESRRVLRARKSESNILRRTWEKQKSKANTRKFWSDEEDEEDENI